MLVKIGKVMIKPGSDTRCAHQIVSSGIAAYSQVPIRPTQRGQTDRKIRSGEQNIVCSTELILIPRCYRYQDRHQQTSRGRQGIQPAHAV